MVARRAPATHPAPPPAHPTPANRSRCVPHVTLRLATAVASSAARSRPRLYVRQRLDQQIDIRARCYLAHAEQHAWFAMHRHVEATCDVTPAQSLVDLAHGSRTAHDELLKVRRLWIHEAPA